MGASATGGQNAGYVAHAALQGHSQHELELCAHILRMCTTHIGPIMHRRLKPLSGRQVNVLANMRLTRLLAPPMRDRGEGYIININSSSEGHGYFVSWQGMA